MDVHQNVLIFGNVIVTVLDFLVNNMIVVVTVVIEPVSLRLQVITL